MAKSDTKSNGRSLAHGRSLSNGRSWRSRWAACGALGGGLAGWVLASVTLGLNTHLLPVGLDVALLYAWLVLPTALVGAAVGLVLGGLADLVSLRRGRVVARWGALMAGAPAGIALALPDLGWSGRLVSDALLGGRLVDRLLFAGLLLAFGALGTLVVLGLSRGLSRVRGGAPAAVALAVLLAVALAWALESRVERRRMSPAPAAALHVDGGTAGSGTPSGGGPPPAPAERVVLLNVDGLAPKVLDELGDRLPFFAEMRREGTSGTLATETPTLSPAIWTTMVTGVSRERHGIRGFLHFHLPGMSRPVWEFPLHSGLNFTLLPALERTLGLEGLLAQYRSTQRTAPALWEILDGIGPMGLYRWRVTWPAESIDGFVLAEGVSQVLDEYPRSRTPTGPGFLWPRDVLEGLRPPAGEGVDVAHRVAALVRRFEPRLVVAGFSSVDGVQHRHGLQWREAGSDGRARIVQRYRRQDRRLARLAELLGPDTDLIVVSDHGFSFEHGHHALAPPGVFLARGPSFEAGRRVEGLSIYDLVPLVVDLFGVPQSEELPGTRRGVYRSALKTVRSRSTVPSYPQRIPADAPRLEDEDLEATKERLRDLGYI